MHIYIKQYLSQRQGKTKVYIGLAECLSFSESCTKNHRSLRDIHTHRINHFIYLIIIIHCCTKCHPERMEVASASFVCNAIYNWTTHSESYSCIYEAQCMPFAVHNNTFTYMNGTTRQHTHHTCLTPNNKHILVIKHIETRIARPEHYTWGVARAQKTRPRIIYVPYTIY